MEGAAARDPDQAGGGVVEDPMPRKAKPTFEEESRRLSRLFLRTLHGTKTVPPSTNDVERLARTMRSFARRQMQALFDLMAKKVAKNETEDPT